MSGSTPSPPRHPVSNPRFVEYVGGVGGVVAQLAAQPLDDVAHRPGAAGLVRSPDPSNWNRSSRSAISAIRVYLPHMLCALA